MDNTIDRYLRSAIARLNKSIIFGLKGRKHVVYGPTMVKCWASIADVPAYAARLLLNPIIMVPPRPYTCADAITDYNGGGQQGQYMLMLDYVERAECYEPADTLDIREYVDIDGYTFDPLCVKDHKDNTINVLYIAVPRPIISYRLALDAKATPNQILMPDIIQIERDKVDRMESSEDNLFTSVDLGSDELSDRISTLSLDK
jgi:hypothetical protein